MTNPEEELNRIDQMLADTRRKADHDRKWQPWLAIIVGMTMGAALFAAGAAFIKLFPG